MITGDHARTALAIARELGLPAEHVLTGAELGSLTDAELQEKIKYIQVFARIVPQQKLRLVEAFKANGEIVAMTGDGVNDAPALKAAHIGVAMGQRGTDVAREAAGLVLLHDDFASLVTTVRLGRRIYDNLRRAMSYTLAVHLPIVGMAMLPVLLGDPLLLLPAHIMFLELIIGPACSIFFEAEEEEANIMHRPPRAANETLFGGKRLAVSLLQGIATFGIVAALYIWAKSYTSDENTLRAAIFSAMVGGNIALIVSNRAIREINAPENPTLRWILLGSVSGLTLVLSLPLLRDLFHFAGNALTSLSIGTLAAFAIWLFTLLIKKTIYR
jgi:Ca2+-transporting ATPase